MSAEVEDLRQRAREDADAAAGAGSVEATLIHVLLANFCTRRVGESSAAADRSWVDQHRVW